jgi:hypothetical protein
MPETPSPPQSAQRISKRVRVLCPAHYKIDGQEPAAFATVVVINLNGLYLATPQELQTGRELEVTISLPGEGQVYRSRARVVDSHHRVTPGRGQVPGVGCAFVEPPGELVSAIKNLSQF